MTSVTFLLDGCLIVASIGILLNTLVQQPMESLSGLVLIAVGLPAYLIWKRRRDA